METLYSSSWQELTQYLPQSNDDILTSAAISIQSLFTFDLLLWGRVCIAQCGCVNNLQLRIIIRIADEAPSEK
jgi:hypothetical protein